MGRKLLFLKTQIPYASLFALFLMVGGFTALCILAEITVQDLLKRVDRIAPLVWFSTTWWIIAVIGVIMGLFAVLLCFIGAIATTNISGPHSYLSEYGWQANLGRVGSHCSVAIFTLITYLATILWAIFLTIVGIVAISHITLIHSTKALCENVNATDCIDLTAIKPVVQLVFSKKANFIFCDDKLIDFCSIDNDVTVIAILTYVLAVVVLIGWLHFLMTMVANWTRYRILQSKIDFNPDRYTQRSGKYSVTTVA
uniref:Uncharacterized protein n=1 Tax=Plectus sambesii TaxID=2011161 RepID=A0A914X5T1_9BILA